MVEGYNIIGVIIFMRTITGMDPREFLHPDQLETFTETVQKLLAIHLAPLPRLIIEMRLGLTDGIRHTADDTAWSLKIPEGKVRTLEARALSQLQSASIKWQFRKKLLAMSAISSPPDQTPGV